MGPISAHARSTFHGEKLNKLVQRSLAVIASGALVFSGVSAASAAPLPTSISSASIVAAKKKAPAVTIKKIGTKTVKGSAKATIKPSYSKAKNVKIKSALLKVVKGKKTVASKKKSVKLAAGTYKVTTTVKYQLKGKTSTIQKTQTLLVKKAAAKRSVKVSGKAKNCPAGYPVKGNRTGSQKEWKYHVKGQRFYNITKPEECFKTAADAHKAGYRASKL
ncbi:sunset domain-containing protein [Glutamicibacter arilaitensis]|uniref:sunset domain-containing protein n=1 Tax=Glutamicibacter arilaitensis TaxID=256701 RepID=UPI003F9E011C